MRPNPRCIAKDASEIICLQPPAGDLACPDAVNCVFTAGEEDPFGRIPAQGSCELTDQAACTASLASDRDGAACAALKCSLSAGPAGHDYAVARQQVCSHLNISLARIFIDTLCP
jgi:hypothetical protein